ncbi:AAA family ATPase, partial [Mariniblastus sp.]|nr:AAA family ATPase [Mariniblastus sp.]
MPNVPASHSFRPNPNASIEEMLERINGITGKATESKSEPDSGVFSNLKLPNGAPIETANNRDANGEFFPFEPTTLEDSKVSESMLEQLICKFLMARGEVTVRQMSEQVGLPFHMIDDVVAHLKSEQVLGFIGQSAVNGYMCKLTEAGRARAMTYSGYCSYFGAAPVAFSDYVASVKAQTIGNQHPGEVELHQAFSDLLIDDKMMAKLGPAVNSGKGMFLFGSAGNGKTSIAERITSAFGPYVWVPRAITVDRDIIRVFDPMSHEECPLDEGEGIISDQAFDHRWVRIKRPTIVVGGELTMEHLELQYNSQTGISEAPVQMKSNTGVLLIDDFGRQRMTV